MERDRESKTRWLRTLLRAGKWRRPLDRRQRKTLITRGLSVAAEYIRAESAELDPQEVEVRMAHSELRHFVVALLKPPSRRSAKALVRAARGM